MISGQIFFLQAKNNFTQKWSSGNDCILTFSGTNSPLIPLWKNKS